jgi:hypothetical protein
MLYKISFSFAIKSMLFLLSAVIIFHVLVLLHFIPINIVWGGRFKDFETLKKFETLSLLINALMLFVILVKGSVLKINVSALLIGFFLWLMVALFSLNTLGNLLAESSTEAIIFTPITFVSAIFCLRIVLNENRKL